MVSAPVALRARRSWNLRVLRQVAGFAARLARPHRVAAANLAHMPLTALGLGCIDAGVFTVSLTAGLIVTGLTLIGLEHLIADEQ